MFVTKQRFKIIEGPSLLYRSIIRSKFGEKMILNFDYDYVKSKLIAEKDNFVSQKKIILHQVHVKKVSVKTNFGVFYF